MFLAPKNEISIKKARNSVLPGSEVLGGGRHFQGIPPSSSPWLRPCTLSFIPSLLPLLSHFSKQFGYLFFFTQPMHYVCHIPELHRRHRQFLGNPNRTDGSPAVLWHDQANWPSRLRVPWKPVKSPRRIVQHQLKRWGTRRWCPDRSIHAGSTPWNGDVANGWAEIADRINCF